MNISELNKHEYIRLIEYALKNDNFSVLQACQDIGISSTQFRFAKDSIFILSAAQGAELHENEEMRWQLSPQAFFYYLQYREFKFAVESSERNHKIALCAIGIAIVTLIATIATIFN